MPPPWDATLENFGLGKQVIKCEPLSSKISQPLQDDVDKQGSRHPDVTSPQNSHKDDEQAICSGDPSGESLTEATSPLTQNRDTVK